MGLLDRLTTMGVDSVTGLGDHLQDTEKLGQIGLSPENYNVISAMNAADNMDAGLGSLMAPAALYSMGDTMFNPNQSIPEGINDFGRYMKGVNIQSNPELAKQLMGQNYVNQMQGKYALAMDEIGKGIFGKGPNPDLYNQQKATNIGNAPSIFDINEVGDPALNPGSINATGIDPYGVATTGRPTMADIAGLGDLGNPTGDSRVVSEEMGMTGTPNFGRPSMADIAGQINENLMDRGNPLGDSRVVSEEQGLSGFPGLGQVDPGFQNELDAREARRGEIAMQQNPDYGQFFDAPAVNEEKRNVLSDLLGIASLAYTGPYKGAVKGASLMNNIRTGKVGKIANSVRSGLGSLGNKFAGAMRGINPTTGRPNTQAQYEQDRTDRQAQSRTDSMIDRIAAGKKTRSNPRDAGKTKAQKAAISAAIQDSYRGGGGGTSSGGKIVCTMMNERYGFGSFRNKIWMKFHESHGPEYQKGYHAIFLPLVKIAKGEGKINTAVRKVLEHMGRHVTADMFKIMKGKKRDTLGRIYRAIFEPACHIIGKIKSALGRG
jgi:hypothetical protein